MLTKLQKNLIEANYGALGVEIVVVILGILIAFQIDRWAQERREREQEHQYLVRLKEDLQFEIGLMADSFEYAEQRIAAAHLLEDATTKQENVLSRREVVIVPERALEIAREFTARQNAVDLLPSIVQHHSFNKIAIEASRDRAQQLIVTIDSLIEEFSP